MSCGRVIHAFHPGTGTYAVCGLFKYVPMFLFEYGVSSLLLLNRPLQDTKFYAFMESFCVAVGIPESRAKEVVFEFDGDKLNPEGTPEVCSHCSGNAVAAAERTEVAYSKYSRLLLLVRFHALHCDESLHKCFFVALIFCDVPPSTSVCFTLRSYDYKQHATPAFPIFFQGEDMDEDDLVDAKVPANVRSTVSDAPSVLKLRAKPKSDNPPPKKATAATAGGKGGKGSKRAAVERGSSAMAAAAGQAGPLGGRQTRSTRSTRSSSRSGGSGSSAASMADDADVVVLSD